MTLEQSCCARCCLGSTPKRLRWLFFLCVLRGLFVQFSESPAVEAERQGASDVALAVEMAEAKGMEEIEAAQMDVAEVQKMAKLQENKKSLSLSDRDALEEDSSAADEHGGSTASMRDDSDKDGEADE